MEDGSAGPAFRERAVIGAWTPPEGGPCPFRKFLGDDVQADKDVDIAIVHGLLRKSFVISAGDGNTAEAGSGNRLRRVPRGKQARFTGTADTHGHALRRGDSRKPYGNKAPAAGNAAPIGLDDHGRAWKWRDIALVVGRIESSELVEQRFNGCGVI